MPAQKTILVTGANGQLGSEFKVLASAFSQYNFIFVSKEELAIDDEKSIENFFSDNRIDICINCAAYTAVDKAESEKEISTVINGTAVGNLAAVCKKNGTGFIHFSTDYVFNGNAEKPYKPEDPTDPVNFYGYTKLLGEQLALEKNNETIIIRTSWVYSSFGKNFVKTMLRLMSEKTEIGVVNDQIGSPTYAADLASFVMNFIQSGTWKPGIYHYSNTGIISWYEFAQTINELIQSDCKVNPILTSQFPTPAKRPAYSALSAKKTEQTFSQPMKDWKESLVACLKLLAV